MTTALEDPLQDLGYARVSKAKLDLLVSRALGQPVQVRTLEVRGVDYPTGSIATGALKRCAGTAITAGDEVLPWSIFVKQLQSARVWPFLEMIPEPHRSIWVEGFPWRIEIDAYRSRLPELLPADMRLPKVYDVIEIDEDRAAIWMEDVQQAESEWTVARFERAAHGLGVLAGRRPLGTDVVFQPTPGSKTPGEAIRMYVFGRVRMDAAGMLQAQSIQPHPALVAALAETGESGMLDEILAAMSRLDNWLDAMELLPQTYVHGDASPQNLLVPAAEPDTFVIIDFGFNSPHCVGFDLGQLLIGLVNAGSIPADRLASIHQAILPAYAQGLASTGFAATAEQVQDGYRSSLLVRSLFTALPLEQLGAADSPELRGRLVERIRLARFLLELARSR